MTAEISDPAETDDLSAPLQHAKVGKKRQLRIMRGLERAKARPRVAANLILTVTTTRSSFDRNRKGVPLIEVVSILSIEDVISWDARVAGSHQESNDEYHHGEAGEPDNPVESHRADAANESAAAARPGDWSGKGERHTIFAQWLVDTYGRPFLSTGAGVLDVAGGAGQVSVEIN